jgi:hypothetical protein
MAGTLHGWETESRQREDGAIESRQRALAPRPVVEPSEGGARRLGRVYWAVVERFTRGLVRSRERPDGVELVILRRGPVLLRFGTPTVSVEEDEVRCTYPILGGLLARRPAGEISFAQRTSGETELCSTIRGFFPQLAAHPDRPRWHGTLYGQVQRRIHLAVSRRYFARLIAEADR